MSVVGIDNDKKLDTIALLGNPNVGKSSLFNALTGLQQKVGNFPGVTVDKKTGRCRLSAHQKPEIIDFPGVYSLFAKSPDERVVLEYLLNKNHPERPDLILVLLDAVNLERSLMLYTQVLDLGFDALPVLNMLDVAEEQGVKIEIALLSKRLQSPIFTINARKESGLTELKHFLQSYQSAQFDHYNPDFERQLLLTQASFLQYLPTSEKADLAQALLATQKDSTDLQLEDTFERMQRVHELLDGVMSVDAKTPKTRTDRIDGVVTHPIFGYLIYFGILALMFQLIFSIASYPMDWIDSGFASLNAWLQGVLPESMLSRLLTEGVISGIGGVVIFIPQIALLFGIIALLEESGYMSRVVFLMDKPMRLFGLSGKSVVPLISGAACAIPAIMSARTIGDWKERLITVFVTPLISCSARLPVYIIIIALVIPDGNLGIFSLKGLTLLGLYLLGIVGALLTALAMRGLLKTKEHPIFIIDLPSYKAPRWKNVWLTIYQKTRVFVLEAGKIIIAISIILWALASYGPPKAMQAAESKTQAIFEQSDDTLLSYEEIFAAQKLEASYIGHIGHFIEPSIRPLGYDWKIGIALICSFAAREVFVGTLSTIYSVGEENLETKLTDKMRGETFSDNGKPVYTLATGLSLLIFYVFAMQCMSTIAIVYRETGGWKWPLIQLLYMSGLAYILAFFVYQIFK